MEVLEQHAGGFPDGGKVSSGQSLLTPGSGAAVTAGSQNPTASSHCCPLPTVNSYCWSLPAVTADSEPYYC